MRTIVQKYGGTSVGSVELIQRVAEKVAAVRQRGDRVAVVVSAMGDSTDRLVDLAAGIAREPNPREMDVLLSTGEQVSIALLAMALCERGIPARSFTGSQVRVRTTSVHRRARITAVEVQRLQSALDKGEVPVVAGFQGVDDEGDITTIGRGGSDTSAVALAVALGADECRSSPTWTGSTPPIRASCPTHGCCPGSLSRKCSSSPARARACCICGRSNSPPSTTFRCACCRLSAPDRAR